MPTADKITSESRFTALFVGPKHSGKTTAACSWKSNPNAYVRVDDFDMRIGGLQGSPWIDRSHIVYEPFPARVAGTDNYFFNRVNESCKMLQAEVNSGRCALETY